MHRNNCGNSTRKRKIEEEKMIKRESVRNQVKQERMDKHSLYGERWYCIHSMESVGIAFTQWRVSVLHSLYGERSGVV